MLETAPPPLAQHIAGIAAGMRAMADDQAAQAGLVAALHALILATLARLLSRLEQMVELWQAGQLPEPPPSRAAPPRPAPRADIPREHLQPTGQAQGPTQRHLSPHIRERNHPSPSAPPSPLRALAIRLRTARRATFPSNTPPPHPGKAPFARTISLRTAPHFSTAIHQASITTTQTLRYKKIP